MKSIKYLVLFVFALTLTVSSCKKDETKTKKEMLTAKSWKMSSIKINGVAGVIEDCEKDDIITIAANGTTSSNRGAIKCDPNETNSTGTWTLSDDEKYLTVDGSTFTIIELTGSKLVLSRVEGTETIEMTLITI
jgi:hypothetical protein